MEGARSELEEARERLAALEAALVTSSAAADAAEGAAAGAARRVAALEAEASY